MKRFSTIAVVFLPDEAGRSSMLFEGATTIARWMSAELHVLACTDAQAELERMLLAGESHSPKLVPVFLHLFEGGFVEGLFDELEKSGAELLLVEYATRPTGLKNAVIEACPIPILLVPTNS